jgi:hypothetical protein
VTADAALAAFRRSTGMPDPVPDYLDPWHAAAILRDITAWYEVREGGGPWCWKCGKTAEVRRSELDGESLYCAACMRQTPGIFHPLEAEARP